MQARQVSPSKNVAPLGLIALAKGGLFKRMAEVVCGVMIPHNWIKRDNRMRPLMRKCNRCDLAQIHKSGKWSDAPHTGSRYPWVKGTRRAPSVNHTDIH